MVPTLAASDLIAEVKSRKGDSAIRIPTARRTSFIRWSPSLDRHQHRRCAPVDPVSSLALGD